MYRFTQRCKQLFGLLQDDLSKDIFKARFLLDMEPSMSNAMRVLCLNEALQHNSAETAKKLAWKDIIEELNRSGKKIILYGAGMTGSWVASLLQYENVTFYGFCDDWAASTMNELMGKPVMPAEYLFQHSDECYVIPTVGDASLGTILSKLAKKNFPEDHILRFLDAPLMEKQYFDFPSLYRRGTAFVDAGCFDCATTYAFLKWCGGAYSQIFAFEPDPKNYEICLEKSKQIPNFTLIQAGLAECSGTAEFLAMGSGASYMCTSDTENMTSDKMKERTTVRITTIDDMVGSTEVGMIKMDIEGAELAALQGAEQTLRRDKPLLALCVYHLPGDTLALMDYLQKVVPEYRFWLRHYAGPASRETVLYASTAPLAREQ